MSTEMRNGIMAVAILLVVIVLFPLVIGGWMVEDVPEWMQRTAVSLTGRPSDISTYTGSVHNWLSFTIDDVECAWLTRDLCVELGLDARLARQGWATDISPRAARDIVQSGDVVTVWGWRQPEFFVVVAVERAK